MIHAVVAKLYTFVLPTTLANILENVSSVWVETTVTILVTVLIMLVVKIVKVRKLTFTYSMDKYDSGKIFKKIQFNYFHFIPFPVCILACLDGYSPDSLCVQCNKTDICVADRPCKNSGTCVLTGGGGYECSCTNRWSGTNCTQCAVENCGHCASSGCVQCIAGYNVDISTGQCG